MLLQIIIFAFILVTIGAKEDGLKCKFKGNEYLECVLSSKYDKFDVSSLENKDKLEEVEEINLTVGTPEQSYEPPVNSSGIQYPDWGLMKKISSILIQFNLKPGQEELSLDLEEFQYMSVNSFKEVHNLLRLEVSSSSAEVKFEVDMVSGSSQLEKLWVQGASIDAQEGWNNFANIKDLKLAGVQVGSVDLGRLPLKTLTSLDLNLKEFTGMNATTGAEMSLVTHLSLAVSQPQPQDWAFINTVAEHLETLKLDGFALGNIQKGTINLSSKIKQLTLSRSSDTRSIGKYSFNNANYTTIELSNMEKLNYVEEFAFSGANRLETLSITEMPALTELTQPLGEDVAPNTLQFNNNTKLAVISIIIFQGIGKNSEDIPQHADVRGTELDSTCPCQASFLAAMSVIRHVDVKSNCLKKWVEEKYCKQDTCWTFDKPCNGSCSNNSYNPFEYKCECESSNLVMLPDGRTCASLDSCTKISAEKYKCSKYNAICHKRESQYTCHCYSQEIWSDTNNQCIKNSVNSFISTILTKNIPIPIITNSTISANTIGPTVITLKPLHTPTSYSPTKSLKPATKFVTDRTLVPAQTNSTTHTVTPNSLAPAE